MLLVSDPEDSLDGEQDALTPRAPRQVVLVLVLGILDLCLGFEYGPESGKHGGKEV